MYQAALTAALSCCRSNRHRELGRDDTARADPRHHASRSVAATHRHPVRGRARRRRRHARTGLSAPAQAVGSASLSDAHRVPPAVGHGTQNVGPPVGGRWAHARGKGPSLRGGAAGPRHSWAAEPLGRRPYRMVDTGQFLDAEGHDMSEQESISVWLEARMSRIVDQERPCNVLLGPDYLYRPEQLLVHDEDVHLV